MNPIKPDCGCKGIFPGESGFPDGVTCPGQCCLREVPEGKHVRVRGLRGGGGMRSRLCALGFTPGTEVTVYGSGENGCRVQVRDTCVVLDCGSAENILCDAESGAETLHSLCNGARDE